MIDLVTSTVCCIELQASICKETELILRILSGVSYNSRVLKAYKFQNNIATWPTRNAAASQSQKVELGAHC